MNSLLAYLFVLGLVLFILGVVLLSTPENVKGIGGFMVAIGLLLSVGIGGYWIYNKYIKKEQ